MRKRKQTEEKKSSTAAVKILIHIKSTMDALCKDIFSNHPYVILYFFPLLESPWFGEKKGELNNNNNISTTEELECGKV